MQDEKEEIRQRCWQSTRWSRSLFAWKAGSGREKARLEKHDLTKREKREKQEMRLGRRLLPDYRSLTPASSLPLTSRCRLESGVAGRRVVSFDPASLALFFPLFSHIHGTYTYTHRSSLLSPPSPAFVTNSNCTADGTERAVAISQQTILMSGHEFSDVFFPFSSSFFLCLYQLHVP